MYNINGTQKLWHSPIVCRSTIFVDDNCIIEIILLIYYIIIYNICAAI